MGAVGVGVEAVEVQFADFGAPRTAPAGDQQRATLQWALKGADPLHQRLEVLFGDVARNLLHLTGDVGRRQGRTGGHIVPLGVKAVAEERVDLPGDHAAVRNRQLLVRVFDFALALQPGQEIEQIRPLEFGETFHRRTFLGQPVRQSPQRLSGHLDGRFRVDQRSFCHIAIHDGRYSGHGAQRTARLRYLTLWKRIDNAGVVERNAGAERSSCEVRQRRFHLVAEHFRDAGDGRCVTDCLAHVLHVVGGQRGQFGICSMQNQPRYAPVDAIPAAALTQAQLAMLGRERVGLLDQRQAEAFGDRPGFEHTDSQHPSPVELKPPGKGEIDQVMPGLEIDPLSGHVATQWAACASGLGLVVTPPKPGAQRQLLPCVQIGVRGGEAPCVEELTVLSLRARRASRQERLVFAEIAMPRTLSMIGDR